MTIQLPPQIEAMIEEQVASGRYASAGEVVEAGVRLLDDYDRRRRRLLDALAEGDQGEAIPYTPDLVRQLRDEADEMARQGVRPDPDVWP